MICISATETGFYHSFEDKLFFNSEFVRSYNGWIRKMVYTGDILYILTSKDSLYLHERLIRERVRDFSAYKANIAIVNWFYEDNLVVNDKNLGVSCDSVTIGDKRLAVHSRETSDIDYFECDLDGSNRLYYPCIHGSWYHPQEKVFVTMASDNKFHFKGKRIGWGECYSDDYNLLFWNKWKGAIKDNFVIGRENICKLAVSPCRTKAAYSTGDEVKFY